MGFTIKCVLTLFFLNFIGNVVVANILADLFSTSQIVPDVIQSAPTTLANVTYPSGVEAHLGNELTPTQVKDAPTVQWDANADLYYTLIFIDPDSPARFVPKYREWLHWLVVNIPGNVVENGTIIAEYIGAGPPLGTDLHRYTLLVYSQPSEIAFNETQLNATSTYRRSGFSTASFAREYNFTELVAGNFFVAQFDSYVPILLTQLGINKATTFELKYTVLFMALAFVSFI